jgi:nitric oxide reductase subunit B
VLFTVKALRPALQWPDRMLRLAFWSINIGLGAMVVISILPVGLMQTWAAVEDGYWYSRSEEFLETPLMDTLRWLRVIGDTIFAVGAITFVLAVAKITIRRKRGTHADAEPTEALPKASTRR